MSKPKLNLFDFTMIMVTLVIGMGIFRTPANVAASSPTPAVYFSIWILGGFIALCGALTYAEIGSRYPVTGGYYKIFSYAYHPSVAFSVNCIILISNAASMAGVALIGSEYIIKVVMQGATDTQHIQVAIAIGAILLFYGVNLAGLKMSARAQNILGIIKICLILLLITPLFFYTGHHEANMVTSVTHPALTEYLKAFGLGLVAVSFTYTGYQQSINFGDEVKEPAKNVPRGIFLGLLIIIALYLTINYAYYKVIGFAELKTSSNIAAIMAGHVFGSAAGNILSVLLFLSVLAYVNVLLMANPRVMQAMSEEGMLPETFSKRTVRTNVLITSLSVFASLSALVVFWAKTFDEILSFTIFLDCFGTVLSAASIFKLRRKTKHLDNTGIYKMKLFPVLPVIYILAYSFVAVSIFIDKPATGFTGLAILAGFIIIYFLVTVFRKNPPGKMAVNKPI